MEIICKYSTEADDKFISDFISVQNAVFGGYTLKHFNHKFRENIYGPSVLAVVYNDSGNPIAARALWRNDIDGRECYQPGDTCVLKEARGKGVFSQMTIQAIKLLPPESVIYNFPNQNSYPGYKKLGWDDRASYHLVLLTDNRAYSKEHPTQIDERYFDWWVKPAPGIHHIHKGAKYYLVKAGPRRFCYTVIGEVSEDLAKQMPKLRVPALIFYKSCRVTFYNKRFATSYVVSKDSDISYVPTWKIDAL
jgi:hypothetical protein